MTEAHVILHPQRPENISRAYRVEVKLIKMSEMPTKHLLVLMPETNPFVSGMKQQAGPMVVQHRYFSSIKIYFMHTPASEEKTLAFK